MKKWLLKLEEILLHIKELNEKDCGDIFFRGQSDINWKLSPSLARIGKFSNNIENRIYYDFVSYGGHLLPSNKNSWDILFFMQHHGIPTRLLDWSENFTVALYFALRDTESNKPAALWLLNPFDLNVKTCDKEWIDYLDVSYPKGYYNYFVDDGYKQFGKFPAPIVAIGANPPNQRIVAQKGVFTFHSDFSFSLEDKYPDNVIKVIIEPELFDDAKRYLSLIGVNEFSLFPDLDGLCRYIKKREINKPTP